MHSDGSQRTGACGGGGRAVISGDGGGGGGGGVGCMFVRGESRQKESGTRCHCVHAPTKTSV